jgi:superfamily I DNA and RNA helicase
MFGLDENLAPNIPDSDLNGYYAGKIEKDYILPNSYRNPRKVLMYAHGLGMGLYSQDAKYPMKDKISWEARGYKIIEPKDKSEFEYKDVVIAERPDEFSKNNLEELINANSQVALEPIIQFNKFKSIKEELNFVVSKVDELINVQKVAPEEIIIISLNNKAEAYFKYLRSNLNNLEDQVLCITPGFVESTDLFKEKDRVTLTTAFRAKGNEANFVFVICCDIISSDLRLRNSLFVSITRSRGWTYLSGSGENTATIEEEINLIESKYPKFEFEFPKKADIERRAHLISREDNKENRLMDENVDKILLDEKNIALLIEKAKDNPKSLELLKRLLNGDE